jgi:hypothetical protein
MVAICSSDTSVDTQRTTRRYIPVYGTLHRKCLTAQKYRRTEHRGIEVNIKFRTQDSNLGQGIGHPIKKKLRGFGPLANYADQATAACWRSCANFCGEVVAWSVQWIPPVVTLGFLDRSRYYFFQVAPQLSSRGWVDPVPDPLLLRKSGSAGNRTQNLWICSQKLWPLDQWYSTWGTRKHLRGYVEF